MRCRLGFSGLHCAASHETEEIITTAVRASHPRIQYGSFPYPQTDTYLFVVQE
jgi:hypothetical protein